MIATADHSATTALRRACWAICVAATLGVAILLWHSATDLNGASLLPFIGLTAIAIALHAFYTCRRPSPFIAGICGGLAVITWSGSIAAITALAALRDGHALVDAQLLQADLAMGLDTYRLVRWVAFHPWAGELLQTAYLSALPLLLLTFLVLSLTRRQARAWELCVSFAGSATGCAFLSVWTPAIGAIIHHGLTPDIAALLPPDAGRFYLDTFQAYHCGFSHTIDMRHLEGVVTFPSFHVAMALMVAYGLRGFGIRSALAWLWCAAIIVSTIPIGGHYAIDLPGGAAIWAIFALPWRARYVTPCSAPARRSSAVPARWPRLPPWPVR